MSLAAAVAAGPVAPRKGPTCTVGAMLHTLPPAESEALAAMLDDPTWQGEAIGRTIARELGVRVAGTTIARHRRGACACESR